MNTARTRQRGELESGIMHILWAQSAPLSAKEIRTRLGGHTPAYTTVMTALGRLEKKGHVVRSNESPKRVLFKAARSAQEQASQTMISALGGAANREDTLLRFAGNLDDDDVAALRRAIGTRRPLLPDDREV